MIMRGWTFILASFVALGCGEATVRPFLESVDGGAGADASSDAGMNTTRCRSDLDCPPGEECEREGAFCKPHGGDGGGGGGGGGGGSGGSRDGSNSGPG